MALVFGISACAQPSGTHEGQFGFYPDLGDTKERIYSGREENMLLTVVFGAFSGATATVEVLVNGAAITDGTIKKVGIESRTFKLLKVNTIDLQLEKSEGSVTGTYLISTRPD